MTTEEYTKAMQRMVNKLASTAEKWEKVRALLMEDIQATMDAVDHIDKIMTDRENELSKRN